MERSIQIFVARLDIFICSALRWLAVVVPLAFLFFVSILAFRKVVDHNHWFDPYWIDYDAPGVDITSEGPDDDFTENWYGGEDDERGTGTENP